VGACAIAYAGLLFAVCRPLVGATRAAAMAVLVGGLSWFLFALVERER